MTVTRWLVATRTSSEVIRVAVKTDFVATENIVQVKKAFETQPYSFAITLVYS